MMRVQIKELHRRSARALIWLAAVLVTLSFPRGASADALPADAPSSAAPAGAPGHHAPRQRAQPVKTINLAHCLGIAAHRVQPNEARCPGFLSASIEAALQQCGEAGGKLVPVNDPAIWTIDVNGDRKSEYLFELDANFDCEGAYSIFSCGSLGCPLVLFEQRQGRWRDIGDFEGRAADTIEVLATDGATGYRELRVGCSGEAPCGEFAYYRWTGQRYELVMLDVRGYTVDVAGSVHGLWDLARETSVLATPAADGQVLRNFAVGTAVAIIGQARGAPYYYVSPCNACESGFIEKSAVRGK